MIRRFVQRLMGPFLVSQVLMSGLVHQAAGQSAVMLEDTASRCTIFRALSARVPAECQGRSRSIVLNAPSPATMVASNAPVATGGVSSVSVPAAATSTFPEAARPDRRYAFSTRIPFAFDSYQLSPEAYPLLDTLAAVLKDGLMIEKVVRIEGHTDSTGLDEYNLILSTRRALAVQRYLSERHGIASARLPVVGKGKYELYDPERPTDAVNRRVQFVNVSDSGERR